MKTPLPENFSGSKSIMTLPQMRIMVSLAVAAVCTLSDPASAADQAKKERKSVSQSQKTTVIEIQPFNPPPRPSSLTNPPTLGAPEILVSDTIKKLMGEDIAIAAQQKMMGILFKTDRFNVIKEAGEIVCEAKITDYCFQSQKKETKFDPSLILKFVGPKLNKNLDNIPSEIGITTDATTTEARCGVSVMFSRRSDKIIISMGSGLITISGNSSDFRAKIFGMNLDQTKEAAKVESALKGRLFELAAEQAMLDAINSLDLALSKMASTTAKTLETVSQGRNSTVKNDVFPIEKPSQISPKFCYSCGYKLEIVNIFCPECGTKVEKSLIAVNASK